MKKLVFLVCFVLTVAFAFSQTSYPSYNINLLSHIDPETGDAGDGRNYSGCWGWYQASKNKEYAIVGTATKTYFIDITNPYNPQIKDSVMGRSTPCTWRELKTYQNYCYIASDVCNPNSFQIVDMQYLPDSVHVVYDDTTYFEKAHTLWVDGNKLYAAGFSPKGSGAINMAVYSLTNPAVPTLIRRLSDDYPSITYVHDMFVRNDTVYASAALQGLQVFRLTSAGTFTSLGSLTGYLDAGYNHSSYITPNGKTLVFCDETSGKSIKVADVTNLGNITISAFTKPNNNPEFVAHNPYVYSNKWVFVSCYQDGLLLYDISTPGNPILRGFFDTYPQGGANASNNYFGTSYRGNWGAYPYFPSGVILACDMQNGIFLLESDGLLGTAIGVNEINKEALQAKIYPNPANEKIQITLIENKAKSYSVSITTIVGQIVFEEENLNDCSFPVTFKSIDVSAFESGSYIVTIKADNKQIQKKIIIAK